LRGEWSRSNAVLGFGDVGLLLFERLCELAQRNARQQVIGIACNSRVSTAKDSVGFGEHPLPDACGGHSGPHR